MKRVSHCLLLMGLVTLLMVVLVRAQTAGASTIETLDPALDAVVSVGSKLELLGEHFGITEGPLWIEEKGSGYLLFSDIPANAIYKRTPDGRVSVFLEKSGYTGTDILNAGGQSTSGRLAFIVHGSNGLTLDPEGRIVIATHGDRNIVRLEKDGTRTVVADRYEGKRFNGPNDVVVKSNGALYFTDNQFGLRGGPKSPARELPFFAVFLVKNGKVEAVAKDPEGGLPNGIGISPDEKYLYVGSGGKVIKYDIQADDTLANGRVLIESGTDGMKVDRRGNLYLTTTDGVAIVSPEGKRLGVIRLPQMLGGRATNVAFGEPDAKTLYITAQTRLYRIRLNMPGTTPAVRR